MQSNQLLTIKNIAGELYPKKSGDFRYAVLVLVAIAGGTSKVERLQQLTGYSRSFVEKVHDRMTCSGLWVDGCVDVTEWMYADRLEITLAAHTLVAKGKVGRASRPDGKAGYELFLSPGWGEQYER